MTSPSSNALTSDEKEPAEGWFSLFWAEWIFYFSLLRTCISTITATPKNITWKLKGFFLFWACGCCVAIGLILHHLAQTPVFVTAPVQTMEPVVLPAQPKKTNLTQPVREEPKHFPKDSRMPGQREITYSKPIGTIPFSPETDLVLVDDQRVWWESDHDKGDTENDHQVHRAMEIPLRRLIELTTQAGGELRVQDSYRASGIHTSKSLHKEGRAVDVTCTELGLEKVAKLCWAAGFDWVFYEASSRGGAHVHASVKPTPDQ